MSNIHTFKDHFKESQLYTHRTVTAGGVVIVLLMVLVCQLIFLQISQHDMYRTLSLNNQVRIIPIPPPSGFNF